MTKLILYTDGASRGNPGPAALGIVLTDSAGTQIHAMGEWLGRLTSNEAEYRALLRGLDVATANGATELEIRTDSLLLARQLTDRYQVRAANLKPLHQRAKRALKRFGRVSVRHIPRELNQAADALANQALDRAALGR